jgi:sec-independent protein translocase protein TatA
MPNIGLTELLIIAGIALLFFGARLPKVGKALGEGIHNFKKGLSSSNDEASEASRPRENAAPPAQVNAETTPSEKARVSSAQAPTSLSGHVPATPQESSRRETIVDVDHETRS